MRLPISLIIDDGACVNPAYWLHPEQKHKFLIPNAFTRAFADLCQQYGVKGKFSVMPMPSGLGRLDSQLNYVPPHHLQGFLSIVRKKIASRFDITPELLTHQATYNLKKGNLFHIYEDEWVKHATMSEITDYLSLAFRILRNVGLTATGVTSPWDTGIHNEPDYAEAIGRAYYRVFRRKFTWYFLHCLGEKPPRRPWISWRNRRQGLTVVSVPALTSDPFWGTVTAPTQALARRNALQGVDRMITRNGRQGRLRELFDSGYPLILLTHWQNLFAEGRSAGLDGLEELFIRIERIFGDRVEWVTLSDLARSAVPGNR
ncbi:MAG: hypothetical protein KJ964_12405 [Verrucomicrobia bacterium]|nr:hypothetical protein [Verrucomicrobiota bacterium]MBU1736010.1 hypothetical protein [Verrucomicrobiota bacterium]MBU1856921.1 hypothetical protein [Verrucomicrobiota bacterium]